MTKREAIEDAKTLRQHAAGLTYNDTQAEAIAKHRLHEIAMRIETGYYTKPNDNLSAAAPDLLEVVKAVMSGMHTLENRAKARAAIAKATGGEG